MFNLPRNFCIRTIINEHLQYQLLKCMIKAAIIKIVGYQHRKRQIRGIESSLKINSRLCRNGILQSVNKRMFNSINGIGIW